MFLDRTARRPLPVFLTLSAVAVAVAAWTLYGFRAGVSGIEETAANGANLFSEAKSKKYRDVFLIIKQREADYVEAASATYPDVFRSAQKLDQR